MTRHQPKVILVEPSHPGNIGAAARAMKTMSLTQLALVKPKHFPHPDAIARASRAEDILEQAQVCESLAQAIEGSHWVIGISARPRKISAATYTPRELINKMSEEYSELSIAWVFGRERYGLTNEELDLCHSICTIPANIDYSSLNLAAAVQIICYEWLSANPGTSDSTVVDNAYGQEANSIAPVEELEGFYNHLWSSLASTGFMDKTNPKPLMRKIRRIFDRNKLTRVEINILRGILKSLNKQ